MFPFYRQSDDKFISLLNKVRDNKIDEETLIALNKRFVPGFANNSDDGYITLTSHVAQSQKINENNFQSGKRKKQVTDYGASSLNTSCSVF